MNETCQSCRFWTCLSRQPGVHGECSRYPRVAAPASVTTATWILPVTVGSDACGEWRGRPADELAPDEPLPDADSSADGA